MVIKFGEKMKNYQDKKKAFADTVKNGADQEKQDEAFGEMMDALTADLTQEVKAGIADENYDSNVLIARGVNQLTNEEKKFYNELVTDVGYKDDKLLPETIISRVFEEIETEHPFLGAINIQNMGIKTRIIESEPEGQVVWGKLFGEIKGQLDAVFTEKDLTLSKATCYVVVPKDLKDSGVTWVDAFVRAQIREAYAVAFEKMAILGNGRNVNEPVGMMKNINRETGAVEDKAVSGTLTFADADTSITEMRDILVNLSVSEKGKPVRVKGNVVIAVNPTDSLYAEASFMRLNNNAAFVAPTPFNVVFVENEFVASGKAVPFVKNRYTMGIAGDRITRVYDQTLAIEDCDLYTTKQFAYGEPKDNKSSAVYDLAIDGMPAPEETPTGA
ncbi:phage major capsid protein [Salinicoccus sesuvii]|uniref:Phage major capsid protein n=1 Tax=Salinicoccus sesuvii TaxID=868281 RepID=A0ABV7N5L9_9STAP